MDNVVYNAEDVYGWLVDPTRGPSRPLDPIYFGSVVHSAFKNSPRLGTKYSPIHGLLRYLLLRRDPITDEHIDYQYASKLLTSHTPEDYTHLVRLCRNAVANKLEGREASPYPLLFWVQNLKGYVTKDWSNKEDIALIPFYLFVMSGELKTELLQTKRACYRLFRRHSGQPTDSEKAEYMGDKLHYTQALVDHLTAMLNSGLPTPLIVQELAYLGMYQALIRAARLNLVRELKEDLETETTWLLAEAMSS